MTVDEQRALEAAKLELRILLDDRSISKTDIVRLGLHHVLTDFRERKGDSYLAQQLRRKNR